MCLHGQWNLPPLLLYARFTIKDIKTVELNRRKGGKAERAVMNFHPDYLSFEVLDFDKARRITGKRLPKE
jgi:hypothetical protein